ncbi:MAG: adenylate/guanylate cyclase domain-containing protein [Actinomycetota bacterium]
MRGDTSGEASPKTTTSSVDTGSSRWRARNVSPEIQNLLLRVVGILILTAGLAGMLIWFTSYELLSHPSLQIGVCTTAAALGLGILLFSFIDLDPYRHLFSVAIYALLVIAPLLVTLGQYSVGPHTLIAAILYVEVPIFSFYLLPREIAIGMTAMVAIEFAVLLAVQPGYRNPFEQWIFVAAVLASIGAVFGGLLSRGVEEATRLSRLRRFLPAQVADAIISSGSGELLEPHRRQIAVLFCDLRGYTKFSGGSEPEEVVDLLDEYYELVGGLLRNAEATIGSFGGDGIMAYFNDPVPCEDPAGQAIAVATSLGDPMQTFIERWRRRGFTIGYGIGIAYGYATLGVVGFEGRHDYTALGSVVNLAARLSDEAAASEVLMDQRGYDAVMERVQVEPITLELKGFSEPVVAYRILPTTLAVAAGSRSYDMEL